MPLREAKSDAASGPITAPKIRVRLFQKYVALFVAVVCAALVINGLLDIWFSFQEQKTLLSQIQREQANAAAIRINQFISEIEGHLEWATQLPWSPDTLDEWRQDAAGLMRQFAAVAEVAQLDASGHELVRMSQDTPDASDDERDFSQDPVFTEAMANKVCYGPVYFRGESQPYMKVAKAGLLPDYGVVVAKVNLTSIWDVVSDIKVGMRGRAYVVDPEGRLIAHPDISMVLRKTDFSQLAQVRAARTERSAMPFEQPFETEDFEGRQVLSAHAHVERLGWLVFVEMPVDEAYAPLYSSIRRSGAFLVVALILAAFAGLYLARRMMIPIRALHHGAARIGRGDLAQRIVIETGDELEALGHQFNSMAARLQDSYATLERKVEERTHQLELANLAKSRFLAAASHDLRQPLHALGLFVAQLHTEPDAAERRRIVERIDAAAAAMKKLFTALLDISKLDAGIPPDVVEFPIAQLLAQTETTFGETACEKGLKLRVVSSSLWVRSDVILLERVLLNLVTNAVRYTDHGGVLVGCRRRGKQLRIEVWDSGPGIPEDQRRKIFDEFYRLAGPGHDRQGGLGLGLAIVDRLCRLLEHPIGLTSTLGKGSCFAVEVPLADGRANLAARPVARPAATDAAIGKLVVVIDDDALVLDAMVGLLRAWGCLVVLADSRGAALARLADGGRIPDLIISDYRLPGGESGIEAIECLRSALQAPIPAFLISGDTAPERLIEARASGYQLLHKPVSPMRLRALVNQLLKRADATS